MTDHDVAGCLFGGPCHEDARCVDCLRAMARVGKCFGCQRDGVVLTTDMEVSVTFANDAMITKQVRVCEDCYTDIQMDAEEACEN